MNKIILYAIIVSAAVGYFIYTQTRMQSLVKINANLSTSLEASESNMNNYKEAIAAAEQQAKDALKAMEENNLGYLSEQKPELIEKAINRGTKNVFKEIETITGGQ